MQFLFLLDGGAVFVASGTADIVNSTMTCGSAPFGGAGLAVTGGTVALVNSVVATGIGRGGGQLQVTNSIVFFNNNNGAQIGGSAAVLYSDVQGGFPGEGNLNQNPAFTGDGCEPDDFHLVFGSPAIDSGDPDPAFDDACLPPSLGASRNDMGAFGGPGACAFVEP